MQDKVRKLYINSVNNELSPNVFSSEVVALFDIDYCATIVRNSLSHRFTNESRNHVGKWIHTVPELVELLSAIDVIERYCIKHQTNGKI